MSLRIIAVILAITWSPVAGAVEALPGNLVAKITERLSVMKPVAAWKLAREIAVEDLKREAVVLEKTTAAALAVGLDPEPARGFFQAQITAAKEIQTCWIERWKSGADKPPAEVPDLKADIRPKLISLGAAILKEFVGALKAEGKIGGDLKASFVEAVKVECLSDDRKGEIFEAMTAMKMKN